MPALAFALTAVAILGKRVAALGVPERKLERIAIGVGMVPRGEVGLVFASIGTSLGVITSETSSSIVLIVVVTTLITPPLLELSFIGVPSVE